MKMLITLETHGIFGSNFAYSLFYVTGRQIGDEGLPSIILAGQSWSFSENAHNS